MHPIIPWVGGKRRLAKQLLPLIEGTAHTCYVEPFAGAAALLFMRSAPAKAEVLNDVHHDLVTLYRVVQHHLDEFVRQFRWALSSREMFRWAKLQHVDTLTDIQRAARFYYLQQLTFGSKITSQTFGVSTTAPAGLNLLRIEEELSAAHLRLARVTIEHLPWQNCIERYDRVHTLFFADPPYWRTQGYGVPFGWEQYEQLAEVMRRIKGRLILTINDHPDVRRLFAEFPTKPVDIQYTLGGGAAAKPARELIIRAGCW
jgi:DNA adenine methylase